jgi:hypothetical protein
MKKLAFVFAAIAVAALTGANAEELGVRVGGDRDMYRDRDFRAARAEFAYGEDDRGLHRGRAGAHRAYGGQATGDLPMKKASLFVTRTPPAHSWVSAGSSPSPCRAIGRRGRGDRGVMPTVLDTQVPWVAGGKISRLLPVLACKLCLDNHLQSADGNG